MNKLEPLLREIRACELCRDHLPAEPRPILSAHRAARILIIGQAPGRRVHESGVPWHDALLKQLTEVRLTLLLSRYALDRYLGKRQKQTLTETVRAFRDYAPSILPLPHPSPRNNIWLRKNPWFEADVIPELRRRVKNALG